MSDMSNTARMGVALAAALAVVGFATPARADGEILTADVSNFLVNTPTVVTLRVKNLGAVDCLTVQTVSAPYGWTIQPAESSDSTCAFTIVPDTYPYVIHYVKAAQTKSFKFRVTASSSDTTGEIVWRLSGTGFGGYLDPFGDWSLGVTGVYPPASFRAVTPTPGETVGGLTPTFQWQPSANASGYQVSLYDDLGGEPAQGPRFTSSPLTTTQYTYNGPELEWSRSYWWDVVAYNDWARRTNDEGLIPFALPTPVVPGPFAIVSPASGGSYYPIPPIQWALSQNAAAYYARVYADVDGAPGSTPILENPVTSSQRWDIPSGALPPGRDYWVHVTAIASSFYRTDASNGPVRFRVTQMQPFYVYESSVPTSAAPFDPTFYWTYSAGATGYRLEIRGAEEKNKDFIFRSPTTTEATYHYVGGQLQANAMYTWSVYALASGEELLGQPGPVLFQTLPTEPFSLVSPMSDQDNVPRRPAFSWTPAVGGSTVQVEIGVQNPLDPQTVRLDHVSPKLLASATTSWMCDVDLVAGKQYFWRVFSEYYSLGGRYNDGGWAPFRVTTLGNFTLQTPYNNATVATDAVDFVWTAAPNAERYTLLLSFSDAQGRAIGNPIAIIDNIPSASYHYTGPPRLSGSQYYFWSVVAWKGSTYQLPDGSAGSVLRTQASTYVDPNVVKQTLLGLAKPESGAKRSIDAYPDGAADVADYINWIRP